MQCTKCGKPFREGERIVHNSDRSIEADLNFDGIADLKDHYIVRRDYGRFGGS